MNVTIARSIVFYLTAWIATPLIAQERFVMPVPDASRFTVTRNIPIGNDAALHADVYRPAGQRLVPLVIIVNSTGSDYTTWPRYVEMAQYFAANGFAAALYRPSAANPAKDFDTLLTTLAARASSLHIDATRLVLWAASTNVTLGLPLAMDSSRDNIRGAVIYYGYAPSVKTIRTDLPVLFVRSGLDAVQTNQRIDALLAQVIAANAPWIIENDASGRHGFDALDQNEVSRAIVERTLRFMADVTRPSVSRAYREGASDAAIGAAFIREDWAEVVRAYRAKTTPLDADSHGKFGVALLHAGEFADSLRELDTAWAQGRHAIRDIAVPAAMAAAGAGDIEHAMHWLTLMAGTPFGPSLEELRTSSAFARIRNSPQFQQFLADLEKKASSQPR